MAPRFEGGAFAPTSIAAKPHAEVHAALEVREVKGAHEALEVREGRVAHGVRVHRAENRGRGVMRHLAVKGAREIAIARHRPDSEDRGLRVVEEMGLREVPDVLAQKVPRKMAQPEGLVVRVQKVANVVLPTKELGARLPEVAVRVAHPIKERAAPVRKGEAETVHPTRELVGRVPVQAAPVQRVGNGVAHPTRARDAPVPGVAERVELLTKDRGVRPRLAEGSLEHLSRRGSRRQGGSLAARIPPNRVGLADFGRIVK